MDSHTLCKMHWTQIILVLLSVCGSMGQDIQLGATWIPTDLNYGVLTNLRQNQLQTNSEQIAGLIRGPVQIDAFMARPTGCHIEFKSGSLPECLRLLASCSSSCDKRKTNSES